jgi:hypothetical protein
MPNRSSEDCLAGLVYQSLGLFPENDDIIVSIPLCPDRSKNTQFGNGMGEDQVSMQDVPNVPVRNALRFSVLVCRSPQTAADGRQHSVNDVGCGN